jgi:hypothetical protein
MFTALLGWIDQATLTAGRDGRGQMSELRVSFSKP